MPEAVEDPPAGSNLNNPKYSNIIEFIVSGALAPAVDSSALGNAIKVEQT